MDMLAKQKQKQKDLFAPISCWNNEFKKKIRIRLFFIKKVLMKQQHTMLYNNVDFCSIKNTIITLGIEKLQQCCSSGLNQIRKIINCSQGFTYPRENIYSCQKKTKLFSFDEKVFSSSSRGSSRRKCSLKFFLFIYFLLLSQIVFANLF